jgi:GNAT superfamily N-acetyltransferase
MPSSTPASFRNFSTPRRAARCDGAAARCSASARPGPHDLARIREIAREAYRKYVPRIGREPAPMAADFAAEIAAGRVVVIEMDGAIAGYRVGWPETDAYLVDNVAIDPARQGEGLGRMLMDDAACSARRHGLTAIRLYTNAAMSENIGDPGGDAERPRAGAFLFAAIVAMKDCVRQRAMHLHGSRRTNVSVLLRLRAGHCCLAGDVAG